MMMTMKQAKVCNVCLFNFIEFVVVFFLFFFFLSWIFIYFFIFLSYIFFYYLFSDSKSTASLQRKSTARKRELLASVTDVPSGEDKPAIQKQISKYTNIFYIN